MAVIRKLAQNFTEAGIDDEVVIMRLDNGELLSLAGTAAAAWRLIDGQRDDRALIELLAAEYVGEQAEIAADVRELIGQLMEARLVAEG